MDIGEALFTYLKSYAGLTSLVQDRIYPDMISQQAALPALAIQMISRVRDHLFRADSTLAHSRYQFSCYAMDKKGSKDVGKQIRIALQNYSGIMGGIGGVAVSAVEIDGEIDQFESGNKTYSNILDFIIWHEEV